MTDADLELALQRWLAADAAATYAPEALHRRVLDIPTSVTPDGAWWHRFSGMPLVSASMATAGVAGLLIATLFFGLFDRPAGRDGETCSNRQVQQALDNLRDAPGYRYVNRDQTRQLDLNAQLDFDDPQYVWTDAWVSEGAYLAPDRVIDRQTYQRADGLYDRGYLEHLQIDGHTYRLTELDGVETWIEETNWPTANLAYGYIGAAFPTFSVPLVSGANWGGTSVTPELPGQGGCTAATLIPADDAIPAALAPRRAVALRVDVRSLRPTAIAIGPAEGERPKDGESFSTWELTWEVPDASEFATPTDAGPDPNTLPQSFVPTPSPSPLEPDPDAWPATELQGEGSNVSDVAAGADRFVAVGASQPSARISAAIWTSRDGVDWEPVDDVPMPEGVGLNSVDWNGELFLAVGHREEVPAEGEPFTGARPETWLSTDGVTWELGGEIGPSIESGDVANVGRPVFIGSRWVAGGSIWTLATNQGRPAFFASPDGIEWSTIELDGVGSGSLGSVVLLADGTLLATGCESPGPTNSGQFGEACYQRPWRSDDGLSWTAGPISDLNVGAMARWGDGLVGFVVESDPTNQSEAPSRLATSVDGVTWEELEGFPDDAGSPYLIEVLGDELVVFSQRTHGSFILAEVWRSRDAESWERIALGFPQATTSLFPGGAVETHSGLVILGGATIGDIEGVALMWVEPATE